MFKEHEGADTEIRFGGGWETAWIVSERAAETDDIDLHRTQAYMLLSILLARPPTQDLLDRLAGLRAGLRDDGSPVGRALAAIGDAAAATTARDAEREFNRLFIGIERGEVVPYASYYLTGFLQGRPLIDIRTDMRGLGITRGPGIPEPEDHVAALAEIMAGLIDGRFGERHGAHDQRRFLERHLAPWAPTFFTDLEQAASAVLYRPVGAFGRLFLDIERDAFNLAET
ncbi:MAG TPA: molecular chaperone TorD family protein [Arenibaculum sp.]|nr:molecular chaperone TorD family protein [Arenibaculum sp.]